MSERLLCIHGHFYQPPREDPFTGEILPEPDAAPYGNWNERITAECYAPNAEAGHFERISFNLGETLAGWLDRHAHPTYASIVAAARAYRESHGVAGALAQPFHHTILPLASRRDKICQIRWGLAGFRFRFGHEPLGMWLPEMAVDGETLEALAAEGVRFTLLSDEQVEMHAPAGGGPYSVSLGNSDEFRIFVRDRSTSNALSFQMPDGPQMDEWLRERLGASGQREHLLLIASDGETFGHHHTQGVEFLGRLLSGGETHGYRLTTPGLLFEQHGACPSAAVIENTAWSCSHGLARWGAGCACTEGDSGWKGMLRRALDNLAAELDGIYEREAGRLGADAWPLRDGHIAVVLGQMGGATYLAENGLGRLSTEESERLQGLLEAQFYRQQMYTSCALFFEDLDRHEPRYAVANAARATLLTESVTEAGLLVGLRRDLAPAISASTGRTGTQMLDDLLQGSGQA